MLTHHHHRHHHHRGRGRCCFTRRSLFDISTAWLIIMMSWMIYNVSNYSNRRPRIIKPLFATAFTSSSSSPSQPRLLSPSFNSNRKTTSSAAVFNSIFENNYHQRFNHYHHPFQRTNINIRTTSTTTTTTTLLQAAAKSSTTRTSSSSSGSRGYVGRSKTLVVHGPPGFDTTKSNKSENSRPFKLVIVESPSKCQTISKILQEYVKSNNLEYDFVVTSCMGHIRNLPKKKLEGQQMPGVDIDNQYRPNYEILPESESLVHDLRDLNSNAIQLVLATDDDREGEAMAWHLLQVLLSSPEEIGNETAVSKSQPPLRVRFTEITPKAIVTSIQQGETSLNNNLVQAQETRRILDRLAGFTVSPILWKKIAPGLSAGRVQSVGMALIVQRERQRLAFQPSEYWDLQGNFTANRGLQEFQGQLVSVNGTALVSGGSDFEPNTANQLVESSRHKIHLHQETANQLVQRLNDDEIWTWTIANVTSTKRTQKPPPPFITSTLQQESNRRLGLSVSRTMQAAQQLYENGYISYMRTDSTRLSEDAKTAIKTEIIEKLGDSNYYQSESSTKSKTKKKNANATKPDPQAAHEAVRPAIQPNGGFTNPDELPSDKFDIAAKELYELIYQRTIAAHMPPQISNSTTIRILGENDNDDTTLLFKATGSVVISPGYMMIYNTRGTEKDASATSNLLPSLQQGQKVECDDVAALIHTTQPPPRYTEASFVQELEALGVGRPSTYAGTVKILRDRAYVGSPSSNGSSSRSTNTISGAAISAVRAAGGEEFTSGRRNARGPLVPSLTAFVVCSLFEKYCTMYVDSSFTARMEERLDKIANSHETVGEEERFQYLDEFYAGEDGLLSKIQNIERTVDADDARRAYLPSLFKNGTDDDNNDDNNEYDIGLFVGPWGPYVKKVDPSGSTEEKSVTAQLPAGMAADLATITPNSLKSILSVKEENGSILCVHPDSGRNIRLKVARYGAYLQCGEDDEEGTTTHTLPQHLRNMKTAIPGEDTLSGMIGITCEEAIQYVNLPRTVCTMNDLPILAAIGPYGPYLKYNNTYLSLKPSDGDILTIDSDTAQALVTEGIVNRKTKPGAGVLAELGEKDGSLVTVKIGRFGSYINWKRVNAKLPAEYVDDPSEMPLEEAWLLISEKAAKGPTGRGRKGAKANSKLPTTIELPPAPKRPLSAYLHFCAAKRPEVAATMQGLGAISKELARLWKGVSDKDRELYVEMAAEGKVQYQKLKKAWLEECDELLKKNGQGAAKAGRRNGTARGGTSSSNSGPKRPRSAYVFFCSAKRNGVSEKFSSLGEISKELGRLWSEATPAEKKEFEDVAADDKLRYQREKLDYEVNGAAATQKKSSSSRKKKSSVKRKSKTTSTTTRKRGSSAYMLFCAAHRKDIVDENGQKLPLGQTTKRLAQMWHECDDETRVKFQKESEKQKMMMI